jgi:hypothetical protein
MTTRCVVVERPTEYQELLLRHGTREQVRFFLDQRGESLEAVVARHELQRRHHAEVMGAVPVDWRRASVQRADLDRFLFEPDDIVVVLGQDGLVANVAKYLDGQPVIGINPEPARNPGVLVPHEPEAIADLLVSRQVAERTMVAASTDDGQHLVALNEVYVGHRTHQSARYRLSAPDALAERQSSSGILIGTGTGSTGWCRSAWQERRSPLALPAPTDPVLCWFVREAWPSPATGTDNTEGLLKAPDSLTVTAESDLVVFGDGMESDTLSISWGQRIEVGVAPVKLHLVV